jgi:hypothetical protein
MPLTLSGNGTLAVGAGTNAISINSGNQVNLPVQPIFWVNQGNVSYTNATITYGNIVINVGSNYNSTNGRFTAPIAGTYFFFAQNYANGGNSDLALQVNGSARCTSRASNATTGNVMATITLAVNDYVTVYTSGSASYSDGSNWGYFGGYLIG